MVKRNEREEKRNFQMYFNQKFVLSFTKLAVKSKKKR